MPLGTTTDRETVFFTTLSGWFAPNGPGNPIVSYQAPPNCLFSRTGIGTFTLTLPTSYTYSTIQAQSGTNDGIEVYFGNCKANAGEVPIFGAWHAGGALPNILLFTTDHTGANIDFPAVAGRKVTYMIRMKYFSELTF